MKQGEPDGHAGGVEASAGFAGFWRMEKLVKHQPGGTPRPGIVPPWLDHEFDIGKEPVEAVRDERSRRAGSRRSRNFAPSPPTMTMVGLRRS